MRCDIKKWGKLKEKVIDIISKLKFGNKTSFQLLCNNID